MSNDDDVMDVIGRAWNVQNGRKVYPLMIGTSDAHGIMLALREEGYVVRRRDDMTWPMAVCLISLPLITGLIVLGSYYAAVCR